MINEILPLVYNNHYEEQLPDKESFIMIIEKGKILLKREGEEITYPKLSDLKEEVKSVYIFAIDNMRFFLAMEFSYDVVSDLTQKGYEFKSPRAFHHAKPGYLSFAGITAFQLKRWYSSNIYCGRCGEKLTHSHKERMVYCPNCKNVVYPKISPVVIVGVTNGDKLMRIKYKGGENLPRYALIAGFAEIGETIEETVKREVMEEAGIKVKNIRYYKSQPWSFSDSLLFGFFCDLDGSDEIHMDRNELSVCEWTKREDITDVSTEISLTNEMIMYFKNNMK